MAATKKKDLKEISLKKETFLQLNSQLSDSLAWLKELIGEKKYKKRIKKASTLLIAGIKEKKSKKRIPGKKQLSKEKANQATTQ